MNLEVDQVELVVVVGWWRLGEPDRLEHGVHGRIDTVTMDLLVLVDGALTKVRDEADPHTMLRLYGDFLATVAFRHIPVQLVIHDAAAAGPDARAVWAELQAERLAGMTIFAAALHDRGHLRHNVTVDDARDIL